jgi:hypothetical protein
MNQVTYDRILQQITISCPCKPPITQPILTEAKPSITINPRQTYIKIRLQSFSTSGYSWVSLADPTLANQYRLTSLATDLSGCPPGVVGCSGVNQFQLELIKPQPGQVLTLSFVSIRPFDLKPTLCQGKIVTFRVTVQN